MKRLFALVLVAVVPTLAFGASNLGVGAPDGPWNPFSWFQGVGSIAGPFAVDFTGEPYLDVTDCFVVGDQFRVYIDGNPVGDTSVPATDGSWDGDPDFCFGDPRWSSGTFGPYTGIRQVTFEVLQIAPGFQSGTAYYRTNEIPEPASLLALGLGALFLRRR